MRQKSSRLQSLFNIYVRTYALRRDTSYHSLIMTSLIVYKILDVYVPSVGVSVLFFSLFIGMACKVGLKLYRGKRRLIPRWFFEMLRLALPDLKRDAQGTNIIYGEDINQLCFALLAIVTVPAILSACFITFWNVYMVEEQIGMSCNPNYDCFPIIDGETHTTSVSNCTEELWPPDTEFQCYLLVYRYAQGISAAGGVLFCAALMFRIFTVTLLAPHNIKNLLCRYSCYGIVMLVGFLALLFFVLVHTTVSDFRATTFRTVTFQIQFAVYAFTFLVVFIITGPLLIVGIEYEAYKQRKESAIKVYAVT